MSKYGTECAVALLVVLLTTSCVSTYRVQTNPPLATENALYQHYLLWMNHSGGVVSIWPSDIGLSTTDTAGWGCIKPINPNKRSGIILALDEAVEQYASIPFSECESKMFYVTNKLETTSPNFLTWLDDNFFSCISNKSSEYSTIRKKWKEQYGSIIQEQGNDFRVFKYMEQ